MIPDWQRTMEHAAAQLAPGGRLHIVDFGDLDGLPGVLANGLRTWLRVFHVTPRRTMADFAARLAAIDGLACTEAYGPGRYYQMVTLTRA